MMLAKVIGNIVATRKSPILEGHKILLCRPVGPDGTASGGSLCALDAVQAGVGDTVIIIDEGNSSRMILGDSMAPVRTMVVGIVDQVEV
jgi:microcompartment protein CcmK/EutM